MKFLFSDSLDYVDPQYDFISDRRIAGHRAHTDDLFPHEYLRKPPYDGILVSRAIVGDARRPGKYSEAQCMRFRREGARAFLRVSLRKFPNSILMGDCGAFSYRSERKPPYTTEDTLEFYQDAGFTHGCSVDHVILDFLENGAQPSAEARYRQDVTLTNARQFIALAPALGRKFTPIGVVQGWSPQSMARAARSLCSMGYTYLAIGGLVPLRIEQIEKALAAIGETVPSSTQIHLMGFGKTEHLCRVRRFGISSFDTTSPLLRAFKDGVKNYYAEVQHGTIEYYTAIRIPQALDNDRLLRHAKRGRLNQDDLLRLESAALDAVRRFARSNGDVDDAIENIIAYSRYALWDDSASASRNEGRLQSLRTAYRRTLTDRAWERCRCRVCRESGVEAVIFRSSNRNKRRGIHNLYVFHRQLQRENRAELE